MWSSAGYVWPLFGITGTIWSAPSTCETQLFCAKYDPQHQPSQPSAFLKKWHTEPITGSLTVTQAAYEAPGPGVTPFEDFIRSRKAKTHTIKHNMPPRHPTYSARCSMYETKIGQHTDDSVHCMSGESRVLPLLRLATAAVRSDALARVSDPKRTVGHVSPWSGVVEQY